MSLLVTVASTLDQLPLLVHCFRSVIAPAYTRLLIPSSRHHTAFITFFRFQHPACNILKEDLGRRDILSSPAIYSISGIQAALGHAGPKQRGAAQTSLTWQLSVIASGLFPLAVGYPSAIVTFLKLEPLWVLCYCSLPFMLFWLCFAPCFSTPCSFPFLLLLTFEYRQIPVLLNLGFLDSLPILA